MNFDDFKYRPELIPSDFTERELYYTKLTKEFNEILDNDPQVVKFFSQYVPSSVASFKHYYIKSLIDMIQDQKFYLAREHETKETRYRAKAEKLFELIKQKKLFNMQILWRAEQLTIPELNVAYHFEFWGAYYINECPFLDEITPKELQVLKDFLYEPNFSDHTRDWLCGWQSYAKIMTEPEIQEEDDDEEEDPNRVASVQEVYSMLNYPAGMPEWYQFYDSRIGTGGLLSLKDIRSEKELKYRRAFGEKEREDRGKALAENPSVIPAVRIPSLQHLSLEHAIFNMLFQKDEQLKFLGKIYYRMRDEERAERGELEKITEAIWLLNEAETPVFFSHELEWKEAVLLAARNYLNGKIEEELDQIYDEYLFFRSSGITASHPEDKLGKTSANMVKQYEEEILAGRKILGEPEDFNY